MVTCTATQNTIKQHCRKKTAAQIRNDARRQRVAQAAAVQLAFERARAAARPTARPTARRGRTARRRPSRRRSDTPLPPYRRNSLPLYSDIYGPQ